MMMGVSFDGLRRNATHSMNSLGAVLKDIIEKYSDDFYYNEDAEIIEKFNNAAMFVDSFNCLYDDATEDDFNFMEHLSITTLDEIEE